MGYGFGNLRTEVASCSIVIIEYQAKSFCVQEGQRTSFSFLT